MKNIVKAPVLYLVVIDDKENANIYTEIFEELEDAWEYVVADVRETYGYSLDNPLDLADIVHSPYVFLNIPSKDVYYEIEGKIVNN